jgi:hypothetical protein
MNPDNTAPVIAFGQQPCGFLPRRFLYAKIMTARRLRDELGGRIVFFYHDSDHDYRETTTIVHDLQTGKEQHLNFAFANKLQKKYTPLYAKRVLPEWKTKLVQQLPKYLNRDYIPAFKNNTAENVADFCLEIYRELGLLEGIEIARSSDVKLRRAACQVDDYFVDTKYKNEIVRARYDGAGGLRLHKGGDEYIDLPDRKWTPAQVSPTRDTRLRWMQSVIRCTHYVAGAEEIKYLKMQETPETTFVRRDEIADSANAYLP